VLEVPALRSRLRDLPLIASSILARVAAEHGEPEKRLSSSAIAALACHAWPGNVRELENALRAAALFAESDVIDLEDITDNVEGLRGLADDSSGPVSAPVHSSSRETLRAPAFGTSSASDVAPMAAPSVFVQPSGDLPDGALAAQAPVELAYAHIRSGVSLSDLKRQIEHDCIAKALAESQGNITRAAALLGMKRPRLSQLVKQYGLGSGSEES
jgi:sigma-54 specific flagellar transcriptional regulator A